MGGFVAARAMALTGVVVLGAVASQPPAAWGSGKVRAGAIVRAATEQTRILYASDWEGPTQIFALDPTGRRPLGQVTFDHAPACIDSPFACGSTPAPASPNGNPSPLISPNGRWTASVDTSGITVTDRHGHRRHLTSDLAFALDWAPNSQSIAYIQGALALPDDAWTGDLKVVSLTGRTRTLVRADGPYGGQIEALSWTRVSKRTAYRRPLVPSSSSVFAGGPVARLAADGSRVAFAACGRLSVWTPPNSAASTLAQLGASGVCWSPDARLQYYDLAVGSDRIYWGEKGYGLAYDWSLNARTLSTGQSVELANGSSFQGNPSFDGGGALAASGDLMVFGQWHAASDQTSGKALTIETLFRGTNAGCPCTAIAYGAAPSTIAPLVPLDTDGTRIALLRYGSLVVIDANGNDLLSTGVAAAGAQIMGDNLLALTEGRLTEYDISSGAVQHSWPLPSGTPGRDCIFYGEPHCPYQAAVKLQDAAHGLVAFTVNGHLHILHLSTGADNPIGYASEARFMDTGLVYADGARINLIPYSGLGA